MEQIAPLYPLMLHFSYTKPFTVCVPYNLLFLSLHFKENVLYPWNPPLVAALRRLLEVFAKANVRCNFISEALSKACIPVSIGRVNHLPLRMLYQLVLFHNVVGRGNRQISRLQYGKVDINGSQ